MNESAYSIINGVTLSKNYYKMKQTGNINVSSTKANLDKPYLKV